MRRLLLTLHGPSMLPRIREPEVMDTEEDARDYDSIEHSAVNLLFTPTPTRRCFIS